MTEQSFISNDRGPKARLTQPVGVSNGFALEPELQPAGALSHHSPIVVSSCRLPDSRSAPCIAEVLPLLARMQRAIIEDPGVAIYVTSSEGDGEGASTVAQAMIGAVVRLPWCQALLLDANQVSVRRSTVLGGVLPDLMEGYAARGMLDVAAVETAHGTFHGASLPRHVSAPDILVLKMLRRLLGLVYNVIIVDCLPILEQPWLPLISMHTPRFIMVLRADRTQISCATQTKQEIEALGGELLGAVVIK